MDMFEEKKEDVLNIGAQNKKDHDEEYREVITRAPSGYTRQSFVVGRYFLSQFQRRAFINFTKSMGELQSMEIRPDDILLVTFPKSGTHWVYEILKMLRARTAEYDKNTKVNEWIDRNCLEKIQELESPRILNTHAHVQDIPCNIMKYKCKTVIVHRNPKDLCASWYNQLSAFGDFKGTWDDFIHIFSEAEDPIFCDWFQYTKDALQFARNHDFVHTIFYENLKQNQFDEIWRLAKFLEIDITQDLAREIANKCSFVNLKESMKTRTLRVNRIIPKFNVLRKGEVGDWKNWFTVSQSEKFDTIYKNKMQGLDISFTFSL